MILVRYIFFAILSTMINIVTQWISFNVYNGLFGIYVAMFFGTLVGLILKYILDKKYIFYHKTKTVKENSKKFILYSLMGLWTTIIFWVFEIAFDKMFDAKYTGAILGLSLGYIIKYFLDKTFVFKSANV